MSVEHSIYVDTTANGLVGGLNTSQNVDPYTLPFYFGDTLSLKIYLLNKLASLSPNDYPFEIISTAGLQLFVYLNDGIVNGTIYTQQISWSTDENNQYFYANLALNTAALQTLLGSSTQKPATLKIGYVQDGVQTTVFSQTVQVGVGIPSSSLVTPPGLTPLSAEVANATFYPIQPPPPGTPLYLVSPLGKIILLRAADQPDGTAAFQADPIN